MRLPRLDQDILSGVPMSLKRLPEGKSPSRMSSPFCKNIFVFLCRKSLHRRSHPASTRGAYRDRHGRWVRDAMDAGVSKDE
jgi:hypothetical protein